jgi:hypothetical protein
LDQQYHRNPVASITWIALPSRRTDWQGGPLIKTSVRAFYEVTGSFILISLRRCDAGQGH